MTRLPLLLSACALALLAGSPALAQQPAPEAVARTIDAAPLAAADRAAAVAAMIREIEARYVFPDRSTLRRRYPGVAGSLALHRLGDLAARLLIAM